MHLIFKIEAQMCFVKKSGNILIVINMIIVIRYESFG